MSPRGLCVAPLILLIAGCASHVEWARDSKSFLYSRNDGSILRYDVATRKSTRLAVVDLGETDGWPVFSQRAQDGLVVFGESITAGNDSRQVTTVLHFVEPDGTVLRTHTLSWLAVGEESDEQEVLSTYVEWSPKGTHVLVTTKSAVAVHDFERKSFKVHENVAPALPIYFGTSPWRPDGAGFLATFTEKSDSNDILFVTLDGESTQLDASGIEEVGDEELWPIGRWEENTLVVRYGVHEFQIDTREGKVRDVEHDESPTLRWPLGKAKLEHQWKDGKPVLTWTRGTERVEITRAVGKAFTVPTGPVVPAPDGKSAIVILENGLVLVDESGVVDRIPVVPSGGDGNQ